MLSGEFNNCYGLKHFTISVNTPIDFSKCNKAIIYAPNGVMKSSFAEVFNDISKGEPTKDRIFHDTITSYSVNYNNNHYEFDSEKDCNNISPADNIYVVKTFFESFEFTKDTVSTLLADEDIRDSYSSIMNQLSDDINHIEDNLKMLTGLTKLNIMGTIIKDFNLPKEAEWTDIFEKVHSLMDTRQELSYLNDCQYAELFNDKTMKVFSDKNFSDSILDYVNQLNQLLMNNPVLNDTFTDNSAEALGKDLAKYDLFKAGHTIELRDNKTVIHSVSEWNDIVNEQLDKIYKEPELSASYQGLKKLLTSNASVLRLREIVTDHQDIIPMFKDIEKFKIQVWLDCFSKLDLPFDKYYFRITQYSEILKELYKKAAKQSERWEEAVDEFNRRFRVPFKIRIENKANFLLKDEAPNLIFEYSKGDTRDEKVLIEKNELIHYLSTGEKKAMYLLYILFDLENIRKKAINGEGHFLIIFDDIADSFDYKNKYAIIEYLNDLGKIPGLDLLILTHNFDFYRSTLKSLNINRSNCYIAQRDNEGNVTMSEFKYQNDFFKNNIVDRIKDGDIESDEKKELLISSIPFYRNLCEYSGDQESYKYLTCFLHLKTSPLNTFTLQLSDLWNAVCPYLSNNSNFNGKNENYCKTLFRIASNCAAYSTNEVLLENKLIIAIACRLKTEMFLKKILFENGGNYDDAKDNQTRVWSKRADKYLLPEQKATIEEVNLITPDSIHLNAFMYEPLIDISDWCLKDLFTKVSEL